MGTRSALRARARADEEREVRRLFIAKYDRAPVFVLVRFMFSDTLPGSREPQYCVYVSPVKNAVYIPYTLWSSTRSTPRPESGHTATVGLSVLQRASRRTES